MTDTVPTTMAAVVYQGHQTVTVEQLPTPSLDKGEVLLEVSHCGICGSDLHLIMEDMGKPGSTGGHEYSGRVIAVGPGVEGWQVGDHAVGGPDDGCGQCRPCLNGRQQLCLNRGKIGSGPYQGAFAAYKKCSVDSLFRVPEGLDLRTAALTEPTAVALRGMHRSGIQAGQRALVTGAGPIGLLTVAVLRAAGVDDITVSEPAPKRRGRAMAVGARVALSPDQLPAPTDYPSDLIDDPFDAAIECSGRADAAEAALAALGRGGVLVFSGTGMKWPRFNGNRIILNELTIVGSLEYSRVEYEESIALLASGRLPTDQLIEPEDVPLSSVQHAMEQLVVGELPGKVLVVPHV
ncbi:MAG TPA: alcohol dehydrogenase catalytic domain-containing protein [Acidimicrobiales bacterium]|nr:alcohol dehydrogenase catalytic domain-containing protein [Acidimicrobiales bacterium]